MKFSIDQLKETIFQAVKAAYPDVDIKPEDISLEHPAAEEHGDYSTNIALKLAKQTGQKPTELADKIIASFARGGLAKVSEANGFINFSLDQETLVSQMKVALKEKERYGRGNWGVGQRWLIEHTSPNPNKAMHLGHLRNNLTGMAVARLWEFSGIEVVRDCIDNDRGIAIARLMWGYLKFARKDKKEVVDIDYWFDHKSEWSTPTEAGVRPDRFVDELYVQASQDFRSNKETEEKVRQLVVDWENKEPKNRALWEQVMEYSHQGQDLTLKRLDSKWDWVWHEHEHYEMGKQIVEDGFKKGVFKKSEGAVVTHLEKYKLPDTVVIKSDGTALYITQDLALTKLKREKFHPTKMFWVIGPEQTLQLKQLFAVCEQLKFGKVSDYTHIAFGWMSIKGQGKMSSRLGNVVYIDELIDMAKEEIKKAHDNSDEIAEQIALSAIKYSTLKVGRLMDTAFDFKESLNFEGDSGPYIQYTYARARSVLRKSNNVIPAKAGIYSDGSRVKPGMTPEELSILRFLYRFPEIVEVAARTYSPNLVCSYLFELAKRFNNFYNNVPILSTSVIARSETTKQSSSDTEKIAALPAVARNDNTAFRLALTQATSIVLANGLNLLGIVALEKM